MFIRRCNLWKTLCGKLLDKIWSIVL